MKPLFQVLAAIVVMAGTVSAQYGHRISSLQWLVNDADLVVRGSLIEAVAVEERRDDWHWVDVTLKVDETLKGNEQKRVRFAMRASTDDARWPQFIAARQEQLWFPVKSDRVMVGEEPDEAAMRARYPFKAMNLIDAPRALLSKESDEPGEPPGERDVADRLRSRESARQSHPNMQGQFHAHRASCSRD